MFKTPDDALRFTMDDEVEMVDLTFIDLPGRWHHITLPVSAFTEEIFTSGVAFDSSSVPGFKISDASDMALIPDHSTGRLDPFYKVKTLSFICDVKEAGSLNPFALCPRGVLRRAEEYLASLKIADGCWFSPEYEFYIFDRVEVENSINCAQYRIESVEADLVFENERKSCSGYGIPHQGGYHAMPPNDMLHDIRSEIVKLAVAEGVKVKYHHHEVGAAGQAEIEVHFEEPLKAADQGMLIKYFARITAMKQGKTVTFMPKPLYNAAGNGMHFHQFLHREGKSLFYEKGGYANLSPLALHYVTGLLLHTPAVMGFADGSTNSYKRLIPGFEAPTRLFFGLANRSACIRIPKYDDNEYLKRIEFRPGDATGNIYLSIAAQLTAGLDGALNKIDPAEQKFGPYDVDVRELSEAKKAKIKSVPASLEEALDRLDSDRGFLTASGVFTDKLINQWIDYKLRHEIARLRDRPHPFEIELYYDL